MGTQKTWDVLYAVKHVRTRVELLVFANHIATRRRDGKLTFVQRDGHNPEAYRSLYHGSPLWLEQLHPRLYA